MQGLANKVTDEGDEVVVRMRFFGRWSSRSLTSTFHKTTKLFARVIYRIYSRYGIEPLERASTISDSCILFYFLHRRISRKPAAYHSHDAIKDLLKKYTKVPNALRRRHGWGSSQLVADGNASSSMAARFQTVQKGRSCWR